METTWGYCMTETLKEFIKKADKGKSIKLISDGKEWYKNSALILAFEEVR